MKRSKIILGILILSVIALVLSGCGGGNLATLPPLEENGTYALRDIGPAGGYIFYDKGSISDGWRYLEAAPSDQSTGIQWYYNGSYVTTGATGTAIGTGQANTTAIVNAQGAGSYAAQLCNELSGEEGGYYDDWFLPSKDELNAIWTNLYLEWVGGFAGNYYWSSSGNDANLAWGQYFYNGGQYYDYKSSYNYVRAVRAF